MAQTIIGKTDPLSEQQLEKDKAALKKALWPAPEHLQQALNQMHAQAQQAQNDRTRALMQAQMQHAHNTHASWVEQGLYHYDPQHQPPWNTTTGGSPWISGTAAVIGSMKQDPLGKTSKSLGDWMEENKRLTRIHESAQTILGMALGQSDPNVERDVNKIAEEAFEYAKALDALMVKEATKG